MPGFEDDKKVNNSGASNNTKTNDTTSRDNDSVKEGREEIAGARRSILATAGRRFTNSQSNQYLEQVGLGMRETLEKFHALKNDIEIIEIGSTALRYPAVAVAQKFVAKGKETIAYFMYPVQERNVPLERKGRDDRNSRRDVPPVPTDVIDSKYYAAVERAIREQCKVSDNVDVICAGVQILGDLFKIDHKEYPESYNKLIIAAVGQTDAVRYKQTGDTAGIIQAANLEKDSVLVGRIDYSPSINEDLAGNPIRSDVNLTVVEQKRRGRGSDRNRDESYNGDAGFNQVIIGIDAIVNFIFTNNDDDRSRDRRDDYPQKFLPEIRISNVENRANPSAANYMFAISHIAALTQNERWVNAFAPNLIRNRPGRNLGGLYAEQPDKDDPAEPVDLSQATLDDVYDMAKHCCQRDVLVTFMAPESSEYSRISDLFFTMASNPLNSDEYLEAFDDLMDELTVMIGRRPDWSDRDPIFASDHLHRCLIGYYPNGNEVLSTEDVDYLSIINNGTGIRPIQTAQDWDSSYSLSDYDEGTTTRANIVQEETDNMVKWTGAQSTLSISMAFLNMLNREFTDVGLGIEIEDNSGSNDRRVRRPSSAFGGFVGRSDGYARRREDRSRDRRGGRGGRRR